MYRKNARKGLSRTDLIACLVLCLLLLLLVPPLFSGSQKQAERTRCRSNLSKLAKAILVYANDYENALPRAGGPTTQWGKTPNWMGTSRYTAFGMAADLTGGSASIGASLYLLVKYAEAPTVWFVCPADKGTTEFRLDKLSRPVPPTYELIDAWDFGPQSEAWKHSSYAYQIPYEPNALTLSRDPNMAVLADRNPWIKSPAAEPASFGDFQPDIRPWSGSAEQARAGNAITHESDGQNVLFLDGRVTFETRPYCAVARDNVYTVSTMPFSGHPMGMIPVVGPGLRPSNDLDSVLVHDSGLLIGSPASSDRRR
jgi:type II secretory pathway pseudopilin PulG